MQSCRASQQLSAFKFAFQKGTLIKQLHVGGYTDGTRICWSFQPGHRAMITISKTNEARDAKIRQNLLLTPPPDAEEDVELMKVRISQIMGCMVFVTGEDFLQLPDPDYSIT